ncbi:MAG TPA: FMN-binding protein [Blastocatellia bacterium]|nr:FMN-binding protein [Blastocatellia bacterium]
MKRREFISRVVIAGGALGLGFPASVFGQERVYLTEDRALKVIFPNAKTIVKDEKELSSAQLVQVERSLGVRLRSSKQIVYRGVSGDATEGYAMILNEIGKEQFITFIVGISGDFRIQRVALMVFRESRGWEVEDPRFTNQFRGKSSRDRLLIGSDIIGVTGATLSSRAFCRGAKKALLICEALYKS